MDEAVQTAPCSVSECPLTLQTGENIIIIENTNTSCGNGRTPTALRIEKLFDAFIRRRCYEKIFWTDSLRRRLQP